MEFQTLKGSRNKKIVIEVIVFITIISMIFIGRSYASYRTTQSINIANGKINYHVPDLRVVAVKLQSESNSETYIDSDTIPTSGYILNTDKSVCGGPDGNGGATKDNDITITYYNGKLTFNGLKKNTRCYIYLDIGNLSVSSPSELATTNCTNMAIGGTEGYVTGIADTTNELCKISDGMYADTENYTYGDGYTYVFRGAVNNNWVKFAGMYWRIVRINGDGSIRMIYSGTTAPTISTATVMTGTGTQTTTKAFNSSYNNNMYVGWKYTSGEVHGTGTDSTIRDYLLNASSGWYTSSGLSSYSSYLADGKFCNDRSNYTNEAGTTSGGGTGTTTTYYGPRTRTYQSGWLGTQTATTSCPNSTDIFTEKVGLITSDEVLLAGGLGGTDNTSYYLYTKQAYRTISPRYGGVEPASSFYVTKDGRVSSDYVYGSMGVRPVINLKNTVTFTGSGTYDDVYKVVGTSD